MKKEELFKMQLGDYSLTDGIYNYEMEISLTNDYKKERCYTIIEKGCLSNKRLFMLEDFDIDKEKILHAIMSVGGIAMHSTNTYSMLSKLRIVENGK
jgi:hypothetical protein